MAAVAVRVVAIVVLVAGPWTDEPAELAGWDAERFQEIAERSGDGWVEQPIEYPPGSVVVFDAIAGDDVVDTNRALVLLSAVAELVGVAVLWRSFGGRVAKAFLVLGLPLVPMGLLRLDMLVTVLALAAAAALLATSEPDRSRPGRLIGAGLVAGFGLLVMAGALIKIWPGLLVAGALAIGKRFAAAAAVATTAVAGLVWLVLVDAGLDPVDQVLSLRGATGWHVESLPGTVVSLFGDTEPRLELNAFRIGTINRPLVTVGRLVAVCFMAALTIVGLRRGNHIAATERLALVMLGSVAALLVTAPLLSPQFLLWLTPWGALLVGSLDETDRGRGSAVALGALAGAVLLTGVTLTAFGPQNLAATGPALLLTVRNLLLLALAPLCLLRLYRAADEAEFVPAADR